MNKYEIAGYRRISKIEARKWYNAGETICVCPNNLRPDSPWFSGILVNSQQNGDFDKMCNAVSYYNCNSEAGRYLSFYLK